MTSLRAFLVRFHVARARHLERHRVHYALAIVAITVNILLLVLVKNGAPLP
jgi:hypothetical protein